MLYDISDKTNKFIRFHRPISTTSGHKCIGIRKLELRVISFFFAFFSIKLYFLNPEKLNVEIDNLLKFCERKLWNHNLNGEK